MCREPFTKKYIITGAPGTGKTTLLHALSQAYACLPEVSRKVIAREQSTGGEGIPWKDMSQFAALVYEASLAELRAHPQALFTDRSILDLMAYLQVAGKPVDRTIDNFPYHDLFRQQVFFAPTWQDIYHQDEQRQQEFAYSVELEKALVHAYQQKGFQLVTLPKTSVLSRVQFIKNHL